MSEILQHGIKCMSFLFLLRVIHVFATWEFEQRVLNSHVIFMRCMLVNEAYIARDGGFNKMLESMCLETMRSLIGHVLDQSALDSWHVTFGSSSKALT